MELLQQYTEKTIDTAALWITDCNKQVVDLKIEGVSEFTKHPEYPNVMRGSLTIADWVMKESEGPVTQGWLDRLKVLVLNFLNESVQAYQILYHEQLQLDNGDWVIIFNCKEYN